MYVLCRPKNFGRHCLSIQKKNCNPYFIVIMITVLISKLKIILSFLLHRTFTSGYLCTIALILFIHVGFLEYLSFKQFKLIVKMTRIESGVTIPKGDCQESDGQNFLAAIVPRA
jgi:hypothetical protein